MTAPEAARSRQTATAGADGQTINHAQQGPPGNAQQRRGPSPTMASTPRATAAAAWPPGSAARTGAAISAEGISWPAAGRIGDAGALDNQQKTR